MNPILLAICVLGGMGLVFGLVLAVASKVFYVKTDPRLGQLEEALPGANCGGCGFAGCAAYAAAVLEGRAEIGKCSSGGNEAAQKMAKIMGVEAKEVARQVAFVRCSGPHASGNTEFTGLKGPYEGMHDCLAATKVAGRGPLICKFGCLGFGNCTKVCKYDAIHVVGGVAKVDEDKCVGCLQCVKACPRQLIVPVNYHSDITIACASTAKGSVTRRGCEIGCLGCTLCEKKCPQGAVHVVKNLAVIDPEKCNSCGLCAQLCPRGLIVDHHFRSEHDVVLDPAAPAEP